jgi:hypothetical protein
VTLSRWLVGLLLVAVLPHLAAAQPRGSARYAGRPLAEALRDLSAQGLRIIFSSELVRRDMRVDSEPRSRTPRGVLDELLAPHGLEAQPGPAGALLIVRRRETPRRAAAAPVPGSGSIRGTVVDARTGVPLPGVLVSVTGTTREVVTATDGTFLLTDLPPGRQPLFVSLVGYGLARPLVAVAAETTAEVLIPLADGTSTYTEHVTVTGDAFRGTDAAAPASFVLTSADMQALRGVLTDDAFRAIQALPGVATGDDFRSEFTVRGSDFRHMGLSIDGVATRWPVHTVRDHEEDGSVALLNADVVDHVTLLAGAYPQDQPGRTGAWIDFTLREGSRDATRVHGAVSAATASVVAEGPLPRARGSWLLSLRQSYLQWLIDRIDQDGNTMFGFTDGQAKLVADLTPRHRVRVTLVGGRSRLDEEPRQPDLNSVSRGSARAGLLALSLQSTLGPSVLLVNRLAATGYDFQNDATLGGVLADGSASEISYRGSLQWAANARTLLRAGTHVLRQGESQRFTRFIDTAEGPLAGRSIEQVHGRATIVSADVRATLGAGDAAGVDAGLLLSHAAHTRENAASPWLLAAYPLGRTLTLRGGFGIHHQFPGIDQVRGTFGSPSVRRERARHADLALESRLGPETRLQVTVYDRREHDVLRLEDSEPRLAAGGVGTPSLTPAWRNAVRGSSRGIEIFAQRRSGRLDGWIGYAYARTLVEDLERGERFWSDADQRHTFNAYAQHRLSPRTSVSARLRLGSNFPVPGYLERRGDRYFVAERRNEVRLPPYARVDVRAGRTFNYERRRLTLFVEVINVFNRRNLAAAGGHVQSTGEVVGVTERLFPVLPTAGILFEF